MYTRATMPLSLLSGLLRGDTDPDSGVFGANSWQFLGIDISYTHVTEQKAGRKRTATATEAGRKRTARATKATG